MLNSSRRWGILLCTLMCINAVSAATPADVFEVLKVTPSRVIKHGVQSKSHFDSGVVETLLKGPQFFSHAVGHKLEPIQKSGACLNWYEIVDPPKEPRRNVIVRDELLGDDDHAITIADSAFLLSPAQRLVTGSPSRIPDGLNYFKAYRILNAPRVNKTVELHGTFGAKDRIAARAVLLCVPTAQWHHHEHFDVKKSEDCFVVYDLLPQKQNTAITTVDQFGLNELNADSSNWLCVRARISERSSTKAK